MDKQELIKYGLLSLGIVLGAGFFANSAFAWLEGLFVKKSRDEQSLEDLIKHKRYSMGGLSEREHLKRPLPNAAKPAQEPFLQIEEDQLTIKKREIMHRIYDLDLKRGKQETEEAFHLRLLGLKEIVPLEQLKKAFKLQAKEFHPDRFVLTDFDSRTKKRLDGRIHDNYVAIQKAFDHLKKNAK